MNFAFVFFDFGEEGLAQRVAGRVLIRTRLIPDPDGDAAAGDDDADAAGDSGAAGATARSGSRQPMPSLRAEARTPRVTMTMAMAALPVSRAATVLTAQRMLASKRRLARPHARLRAPGASTRAMMSKATCDGDGADDDGAAGREPPAERAMMMPRAPARPCPPDANRAPSALGAGRAASGAFFSTAVDQLGDRHEPAQMDPAQQRHFEVIARLRRGAQIRFQLRDQIERAQQIFARERGGQRVEARAIAVDRVFRIGSSAARIHLEDHQIAHQPRELAADVASDPDPIRPRARPDRTPPARLHARPHRRCRAADRGRRGRAPSTPVRRRCCVPPNAST